MHRRQPQSLCEVLPSSWIGFSWQSSQGCYITVAHVPTTLFHSSGFLIFSQNHPNLNKMLDIFDFTCNEQRLYNIFLTNQYYSVIQIVQIVWLYVQLCNIPCWAMFIKVNRNNFWSLQVQNVFSGTRSHVWLSILHTKSSSKGVNVGLWEVLIVGFFLKPYICTVIKANQRTDAKWIQNWQKL